MGTVHYHDAKVLVGGYDLSGDHNALGVAASAEMLDATVFGYQTRIRKGGLLVVEVTGSGFWNGSPGHVGVVAFDLVGVNDQIVTVFGDGITEGSLLLAGFATFGVLNKYDLKGDPGSLLAFDLAIAGRGTES